MFYLEKHHDSKKVVRELLNTSEEVRQFFEERSQALITKSKLLENQNRPASGRSRMSEDPRAGRPRLDKGSLSPRGAAKPSPRGS